MVRNIFLEYGPLIEVITDNEGELRGQPFQSMFLNIEVRSRFSPPFYPETNGLVEQMNRVLKTRLHAASDLGGADWIQRLPEVVYELNSSRKRVTKLAHYELMFKWDFVRQCTNKEYRLIEERREALRVDDTNKMHLEIRQYAEDWCVAD